jgi:hypothetical protein
MRPNDIDPSLCAGEPLLETLDDGFSPPPRSVESPPATDAQGAQPPEQALGTQSPF